MKTMALVVAGLIFSLVALFHVLRLVYDWQVMIGANVVPLSVSMIALIVSLLLAIWMFVAASRD